jgi:hypothetical protein
MSRDELPPGLRDLGEQLREAAGRDIEIERRVAQRLRRGRWRRWLIVAVAAIASAGGIAIAQRLLDRSGPGEPRDRIQRRDAPAADPGVVVTSARPDPDGGPPWALRVFTNAQGLECVAIGRLRDGALGTYDEMRMFRKLPTVVPGTCDELDRTGLVIAINRRPQPEPRTIVYGLARGRSPVRVTIGGETHALRPGALGSFIDVRAGHLDLRGATVSTSIDGRTVTHDLG